LQAGRVSLSYFLACLKDGPSFLGHIRLDTVLVVDHLGERIPVPTMFCATWNVGPYLARWEASLKIYQEFDFVIKGYCHKDRLGDSHVKRNDYEVIREEDGRIINPSELAHMVEPGMVLEISLFLRPSPAFQIDKMCLRCKTTSTKSNVDGWNKW